jgi:DNA-binding response OmpR family regulator
MPENSPESRDAKDPEKRGAPTVLIIDDSAALANFLKDVLKREWYAVHTAPDGANGLLLFRGQKPDITLLGVHVRRGLGWDTLDKLRRENSRSPVVVLGSVASEEAEKKALAAGCRGFISKELGLEAFLHEVKRTVGAVLPVPGQRNALPKGRILVTDDDGQIRTMLQRFLSSKGYEVVTAADGREALAMVKKTRPHLILLDIDMPVMNGLEVLKNIRAIDKEVAVMMIPANDDVAIA